MPDFDWKAILPWAWENREEIRRRLASLFSWYRGNPESTSPGILILGPGGSGKTTLGKLLSGGYDLLFDAPAPYAESIGIERYSLKDAPGVEVVVPPGQQHRRGATWSELHAQIATGKYRGIILLAAYGYHTLGRTSFKDHALYQGNKNRFVNAYCDHCRADEVAILRELAPHLRPHQGRLWLLTLVAKQDLWWPNHTEVECHYREGSYGTELNSVFGSLDPGRLRHEFAFGSLVIKDFVTGRGELLKPDAQGYDHRCFVESLRRLLETVGALKDWEEGR